ncbi:MAG: methyltransferase domain-containing protein [Rhodopirellula sp.]|nr:methyltransferase domain-containing protein [Rhodopirellula sp.]
MSFNLKRRDRQPEMMDDPELDEVQHRHALRGLRRVNAFSRSPAILWPAICEVAQWHSGRPLRILDIASGGGDLAVALASRARQSGIDVRIHGCDISAFAVQLATELATQRRLDNVQFLQTDAIHGTLDGPYDIVMCSLFLHHLPEEEARCLLKRMKVLATHRVLINDLRRTRLGYVLAWAGCRLLTRSPIVHTDGPLSVRAAFSLDEVRELADECGLSGATLTTHWPQRFLLNWKPS